MFLDKAAVCTVDESVGQRNGQALDDIDNSLDASVESNISRKMPVQWLSRGFFVFSFIRWTLSNGCPSEKGEMRVAEKWPSPSF